MPRSRSHFPRHYPRRELVPPMRRRRLPFTLFVVVALFVLPTAALSAGAPVRDGVHFAPSGTAATSNSSPLAGDWPTYLEDNGRSSANTVDRALTPGDAANLTQVWNFTTNGSVAASPIVVRGTVYVG